MCILSLKGDADGSAQVKSAIQTDALDPRHPARRFHGAADAARKLWA